MVVWPIDQDGTNLRPITTLDPAEGIAFEPTWTPDGTRIMFTRGLATGMESIAFVNDEISTWYLQTARGSSEPTPISDPDA